MDTKVIRNRFAGKCACCGAKVEAGAGIAYLEDKWLVAHDACRPELSNPLVEIELKALAKQQEEAKALLKKQEERERQLAQARAEREALIAKLGIDFKTEFDAKHSMSPYSDTHEWSCPFTGSGTEEEFARVINTPGTGSAGALRWSMGRRLVGVDQVNKMVRMTESIGMCD